MDEKLLGNTAGWDLMTEQKQQPFLPPKGPG